MFDEIHLRALGVIDDAVLELGPGLTVVTGETGAGKTMLVTGLGLLLGSRSDPALVRTGAERALVEGRVVLPEGHPVLEAAEQAGAELDEGELLISRSVSPEGRSRAYLGGHAVPASTLAVLADDLVAVHGQSDQQRLLQPARQRAALDRFAGVAVSTPLAAYLAAYERLQEVETTLAELTAHRRERAQEADLLRLGLTEIGEVDPQPGEDAALAAEAERLAHADALRAAAAEAHLALTGEAEAGDAAGSIDVTTLLATARRALDHERGHDPRLQALAGRLDELAYLLADLAADLGSYTSDIDADPQRLAEVQDRQARLGRLLRKYGDGIEEVLGWAETAGRRLLELDTDDDRIGKLTAERAELRVQLGALAEQVSDARAQAADEFAVAVTAELTALAMPHAQLQVQLQQQDDPEGLAVHGRQVAFGPHGVDTVELLLAAHPGAPARPLQRGASGGELSRVMLAVEVVFAGADPVPTFVFDEVDAGVGGRAAVEVGRRLARLARTAQVLVVTHLPQVAAFADRHLAVQKEQDGRVARTSVQRLEGEARVRELARMLAGLAESESAHAHAEELLAVAAAERAETPRPAPAAGGRR